MANLNSIRSADLICLCTTGPGVPIPDLDTVEPLDEFIIAAGLTDDNVWDVDGPHDIRSEVDGRTVRWHAVAYITGTTEGHPERESAYLIGTVEVYEAKPLGGTMWVVYRGGERVGTVDAGEIDNDGQWIGDEDDVLAAATAGDFPVVKDDGLPVYVDGVLVREG